MYRIIPTTNAVKAGAFLRARISMERAALTTFNLAGRAAAAQRRLWDVKEAARPRSNTVVDNGENPWLMLRIATKLARAPD